MDSFRVATKRPAGRNEAGERLFDTDWTTVEAWKKLAERYAQALHKGSRVFRLPLASEQQRSCPER